MGKVLIKHGRKSIFCIMIANWSFSLVHQRGAICSHIFSRSWANSIFDYLRTKSCTNRYYCSKYCNNLKLDCYTFSGLLVSYTQGEFRKYGIFCLYHNWYFIVLLYLQICARNKRQSICRAGFGCNSVT